MPVMLPILVVYLVKQIISYSFRNRDASAFVEEAWLDKSGTEIQIIYTERLFARRDPETFLVAAMRSPSDLSWSSGMFPDSYPLPMNSFNCIKWDKYYQNSRNKLIFYQSLFKKQP